MPNKILKHRMLMRMLYLRMTRRGLDMKGISRRLVTLAIAKQFHGLNHYQLNNGLKSDTLQQLHLNIDLQRSVAAHTFRHQNSVCAPLSRLKLQFYLLHTAFSPLELQLPSSNQNFQESASKQSTVSARDEFKELSGESD